MLFLKNLGLPKSVVCLRNYSRQQFTADLVAGLVVAVVALPLAMAFAIGSGVKPEQGLFTAIVAGFIISALGGSRVQIGGPTGAFVVIVFGIVSQHGYDGLALATCLAGFMLILMGVSGLGAAIKFIPYPVTTGFTTGIAVVIFSSQIRDLFGLEMSRVPAEFFEKWHAYFQALPSVHGPTVAVGAMCLGILIFWPRLSTRLPAPLVAMVAATIVVTLGKWLWPGIGIETIHDRFGSIPNMLPEPQLPDFSLAKMGKVINPAVTIALLAAIESLLSAVVADGMIGGRHRPNVELVAQGVANLASPLFGGIPATGAIARTATNVKTGGRTPVAGMVHALALLLIMLLFAPLAGYVPLCSLAATLVVVAYNMAELHTFWSLLSAPKSDATVLIVTFLLTVVFDLTVAVQVGIVLAASLFIKRMADVTNISVVTRELSDTDGSEVDPNAIGSRVVPPGVEVYEVNGPFFFGTADKVKDTLAAVNDDVRVFILRMRHVPAIDATGMHALMELKRKCDREKISLILSEIHAQPLMALDRAGHYERFGTGNVTAHIDDALARARELLGLPTLPTASERVPEVARDQPPSSPPKD